MSLIELPDHWGMPIQPDVEPLERTYYQGRRQGRQGNHSGPIEVLAKN